ncbi:hypothetical protein RhiXN_07651 [Rhizoctonia solani]|uniref:Uncharacterized protein n=1 Tax=Rhizoctonia solani TaxID=456999 RepID=A0A8H8NZV4_9AGAM|nr:uncharacterized protein RhiXN_07651 [Rhizoctonia solani]QRW22615.1 hypothetical protein RhiXN_07651 [Rhizoctonia solani]
MGCQQRNNRALWLSGQAGSIPASSISSVYDRVSIPASLTSSSLLKVLDLAEKAKEEAGDLLERDFPKFIGWLLEVGSQVSWIKRDWVQEDVQEQVAMVG